MQLPPWLPLEAWNEYMEMRKKKRMITTPRVEKRLLRLLEGFHEQGYDLEAIIDDANNGNWKDFYVNGGTPRRPQEERPISERAQQVKAQLDLLYKRRAEEAKRGYPV